MSKTLKLVKVRQTEDTIEWQATRKIRFSLDGMFELTKVWLAADSVSNDVVEDIWESFERATGVPVDADMNDTEFHAYCICQPYLITSTGEEQAVDLRSVSEVTITLPPDVELIDDGDGGSPC